MMVCTVYHKFKTERKKEGKRRKTGERRLLPAWVFVSVSPRFLGGWDPGL